MLCFRSCTTFIFGLFLCPSILASKVDLTTDPEASWLLQDANSDTMWQYFITAGMEKSKDPEERDFFLHFERHLNSYADKIVEKFEDFFLKFLRRGSFELSDDFEKKAVQIAGQTPAEQKNNKSLSQWAQEKGTVTKKFFGSNVSLGGLRTKYTGNWPFAAKALVKKKTKDFYRLKTERGGWESGFASNWRIKPSKKSRGFHMKRLYEQIGKMLHARYPDVGFDVKVDSNTPLGTSKEGSTLGTEDDADEDEEPDVVN